MPASHARRWVASLWGIAVSCDDNLEGNTDHSTSDRPHRSGLGNDGRLGAGLCPDPSPRWR